MPFYQKVEIHGHVSPAKDIRRIIIRNTPIWENSTALNLKSLENDTEVDYCLIGLGGSGLAAARRLLELNADFIAIDAKTVASGAAGRNGGFLLAGTAAFYHDAIKAIGHERAKAIYDLTLKELELFKKQTPEAVNLNGSLRIAVDEQELKDIGEQYLAMKADNLAVEKYQGIEGKGILVPTDGGFNPLLRARLVARQLIDKGTKFYENSPAIEIKANTIKTPKASITAKKIIVAVDGGLEKLLPQLQGQVRTARLQMLATAPAEVSIPRPSYLRYGYEYYQQLQSGSVAVGGFRDFAMENEWTFDASPSGLVQDRLEHFLRNDLKIQAPITHRWAASVAYNKGILPVFSELGKDLFVIGAYNGTGNIIGSILGRGVADLAVRGESEVYKIFNQGL